MSVQSLHAGCPAGPGGKWISTHWLSDVVDLVYHTPQGLMDYLAQPSLSGTGHEQLRSDSEEL